MKERVMEQCIKEAYAEIRAPEALIQAVILRIGAVKKKGRIAQKASRSFLEPHREDAVPK